MSESSEQIVLAYIDAFNRSDEETMRPLFTDDVLIYGVLGFRQLDQVVPIWREIKTSFDI